MNVSKPPIEWDQVAAASMDGVGLIDGGNLVYANETLADTYGYDDPNELVGEPWHTCYAPDERERFERDVLPEARNGTGWRGEATGLRADGSTFAQEVSFAAAGDEGLVWVVREVPGRTERERDLRAARRFNEELVENAPFGMFRLDEDLRITYENPRAEEIIGLPDDEPSSAAIGTDIRELPPIVEIGEADLFTRLRDGETIEFEFPFRSIYGREAYFTGRGVPLYRDGEFDGALLMATDISERRRQERELERQRDELTTLNRINHLLLEITRELFETPTREDIERIVCEGLAASELYEFAWIGESASDGNRIVPRASAGVDDGYVETATITTDGSETGRGPGGRALLTGEVQVSRDIETDPSFEPWREAALDRGVRSAAAIPLVHGETVYGGLGVYATRPLAFGRHERTAFEVLGEAVGFAIHATKTRQLLFADAVVELEFRLADADQFLVDHSERFECELSVEGSVATRSGDWLLYVNVRNASPTALCEAAADLDSLDGVRVVRDDTDDGLVEYRFDEPCLLSTLAGVGARLRTAHASGGVGQLVLEVPQCADVRALVGRIDELYPRSELIAKRERDRSVDESDGAAPSGPLEELTDRQREVLETAHHAGYFDWPRASTAEDIARSLGISSPTLHRHLRRAEKQLLTASLRRGR